MPSSTSQSYADTIIESFNKIEDTQSHVSNLQNNQSSTENMKVISNVSNVLTDRLIVNKKTKKLLYDVKSDLQSNSNSPSDVSNDNVVLDSFFCGLHPLDSFAKNVDSVIKKWESDFQNSNTIRSSEHHSIQHGGESGTQALIKAICKFANNEKSGCPSEINTYLLDKCIHVNGLLHPFLGSRFNILFVNGAGVWFLKHLLHFLTEIWGTPNNLLKAILNDLGNEHYLTACRALGLVSKCVTGPWQRLVENTPRILDLNDHFNRAVDLFDKWSKDASDLIDGSAKLFDNVPVHKDPVFDSLVEPNDNISTKYLLQNIMTAFVSVSKRQLADQLMGGVHHNPSADLLKQASSCPAHNISGERIFGQLDFNLHRAPNAAVEFVEAKIMFAENKTAQWLNEKTQFEKKCLHDSARKIARVNISKSKEQHKKLHEIKSKLLKEKQEMLAKKCENQRVLKENLLEDLQKLGGLWSSEQDLDHHLRLIKSESKRLSALKVQLKVRKIILSQKEEANLFSFSKNGKKFNSLQLI